MGASSGGESPRSSEARRAEPVALPTRVHVWAKNAVGPSFFSSCTDRFVATRPHLILLELATNLFGGSLEGLLHKPRLDAVA